MFINHLETSAMAKTMKQKIKDKNLPVWQVVAFRWEKHKPTAAMGKEIDGIETNSADLAVMAAHYLIDRHSKDLDVILSVEIVPPGAEIEDPV